MSSLPAFPFGFADNRSSPTAVHAMNEVTIHRGPSSHLIYMNVGVDGQHLTEAVVS